MASSAKAYKVRKRLKAKRAGRDRKNDLARRGTTPTKEDFFSDKK